MISYITIEELKKSGVKASDCTLKMLPDFIEQANEISKHYPAKVMARISDREGGKYLENFDIRLAHPRLRFTISYREYEKKYNIFCPSIHDLKNIDQIEQNNAARELTRPNNIGVLSAKKITDWINYYEAYYQNLSKLNEDNKAKIEEFKKSLIGQDVRYFGENSGEIIKNGIKFSFTIGKTYVTKQIEIYYNIPFELETFLQVSDNKYKPVKKD